MSEDSPHRDAFAIAARAQETASRTEAKVEQHIAFTQETLRRLESGQEALRRENTEQHREGREALRQLFDRVFDKFEEMEKANRQRTSDLWRAIAGIRWVLWSVAGAIIVMLLAVIGYLLDHGAPWVAVVTQGAGQ